MKLKSFYNIRMISISLFCFFTIILCLGASFNFSSDSYMIVNDTGIYDLAPHIYETYDTCLLKDGNITIAYLSNESNHFYINIIQLDTGTNLRGNFINLNSNKIISISVKCFPSVNVGFIVFLYNEDNSITAWPFTLDLNFVTAPFIITKSNSLSNRINPKLKVITRQYDYTLLSQNEGQELVANIISSLHYTQTTISKLKLLEIGSPTMFSGCSFSNYHTAILYNLDTIKIYDEAFNLQMNLTNLNTAEVIACLDGYFYNGEFLYNFAFSSYEDFYASIIINFSSATVDFSNGTRNKRKTVKICQSCNIVDIQFINADWIIVFYSQSLFNNDILIMKLVHNIYGVLYQYMIEDKNVLFKAKKNFKNFLLSENALISTRVTPNGILGIYINMTNFQNFNLYPNTLSPQAYCRDINIITQYNQTTMDTFLKINLTEYLEEANLSNLKILTDYYIKINTLPSFGILYYLEPYSFEGLIIYNLTSIYPDFQMLGRQFTFDYKQLINTQELVDNFIYSVIDSNNVERGRCQVNLRVDRLTPQCVSGYMNLVTGIDKEVNFSFFNYINNSSFPFNDSIKVMIQSTPLTRNLYAPHITSPIGSNSLINLDFLAMKFKEVSHEKEKYHWVVNDTFQFYFINSKSGVAGNPCTISFNYTPNYLYLEIFLPIGFVIFICLLVLLFGKLFFRYKKYFSSNSVINKKKTYKKVRNQSMKVIEVDNKEIEEEDDDDEYAEDLHDINSHRSISIENEFEIPPNEQSSLNYSIQLSSKEEEAQLFEIKEENQDWKVNELSEANNSTPNDSSKEDEEDIYSKGHSNKKND